MSLRFAVLGLLAEQEMSGFDLVREFRYERSVIWPAPQNEIYRELARMVTRGEIEAADTGARNRKTYRITSYGEAELDAWLQQPHADYTLRYEPMLRAVFLTRLRGPALKKRMQADLEFWRGQLAKLEAGGKRAERAPARDLAMGFYQAMIDWADGALQAPVKKPATKKKTATKRAAR